MVKAIWTCAALFSCLGFGQDSFDDLARRAGAALDSQPEEGIALYRQALAQKPDWAEGWLYLGAGLYRLNRYGEARDTLQKGVTLAPQKGPGWAFLGLCEFELGDYDRALADIRKGEALGLGSNPQFEAAVRQRGALILIRASAFDEAMAQLEPLTKYPDMPAAVIQAVGLCALGRPALTAGKEAVVQLAGKSLWAGTSRRPEEAEANYRQLMTGYPNEPGVHYARGLYLMESDQKAALAEFRTETKANPSHWPSWMISAFLETRQGEPQQAIQSIQKAVKLMPRSYEWLWRTEMGRAYLAMEQFDKAVSEFEAAVKLASSNPQMHYYLEQAYRRAGKKVEAQKERAEFLRLKAQQDPLSLP